MIRRYPDGRSLDLLINLAKSANSQEEYEEKMKDYLVDNSRVIGFSWLWVNKIIKLTEKETEKETDKERPIDKKTKKKPKDNRKKKKKKEIK